MRIIVISDIHGQTALLRQILLKEQKAEVVFFLGDGENDINKVKFDFPEKCFFMVRGNCDWGSNLDTISTVTLEDVKFLYSHGHIHSVKFGDSDIKDAARSAFADVLLYGHTHRVVNTYEDGLYIMNPGSLANYEPSYGVIEILKEGILTNIIYVKPERRY